MALLPANELLHIGPDPAGASWNHFDLGQGLSSGHTNYPQAQLGNNPPQAAPWFYSKFNADNVPVAVFSAPLGGATTSTNTQYARDELRGYERDGTTKMAMDPRSGDHWIEGIYRIYGLTGLSKPGVCVQQWHDPNDDTIMVCTVLSGGVTKLVLRYNGTQVAVLDSNYTDGNEFYLKTRINAGTPSCYYSDDPNVIPTTPVSVSVTESGYFSGATVGWYEKTGSYNQTNEITDPGVDPDASIIKVEVRNLKHWHSATPLGGAWPTPATYAATNAPVADAGADAQIKPTDTFTRTGAVTLNGASLTSSSWKILSGPQGAGNSLSSTATVNWTPSSGTTTGVTQTAGVGGIPAPAAASNVELNTADRGDMNITASGTALVPRIYDGGGKTCGRITINASYIIIQNYNIRPNSQYALYIDGCSNVKVQNCDIKNVSVSGDGDLNAITLLSSDHIDLWYNTAINYVSGDPGGSHTDFIQTWVSSSHPVASSNVRVVGNIATGPSNPSRDNSIPSIHQCIMVEGAGHGGNSGGSGNPHDWLVCDNTFGDSWGQSIKLDGAANFTFTRNKWVGSSDHVFSFDSQTGSIVYSDNTFGSGYGNVNATITSGSGPANPAIGGSTTTTTYPLGTYVLEYDAVTSAGTVSDTVQVIVTNTPSSGGGGGGGGTPIPGSYPNSVAVGTAATSDGSGTITVAAPAGVGPNQFQICIIQCSAAESVTSVPAGWQLLDSQAVANADYGQPGGDSGAWIFYNTTGDSQTRSWGKSGTRGFHAVRMAWKDYAGLGQHSARASAYTTTPFANTVTPTSGNALVVSVLCSDRSDIGPSPVSVPTGWTQRYSAGPTVNVNEIEWIAVAELQAGQTPVGANAPTGTGTGTSNFKLTNPDDCSMFTFVLEGLFSSGTSTAGAVTLNAGATLRAGVPVPIGTLFLTANVTLVARSLARGNVALPIVTTLTPDAKVFLRGALIIVPVLTFQTQQLLTGGLLLQALAVLQAGALPYRKPVLRNNYQYPPPNHPFRLIAQRILDGEIIEWELPVGEDFEYQVQLSGPAVMHGSFPVEMISVQELALDGYAYWLHVEINQEIRASAILLPPQYEEAAMNFSAEGVAAAPHYTIYGGTFSQLQVDPLSVVRTLWNYVQGMPQSDYGVVVSTASSDIRLGEPAHTETTVTKNADGTTTTTTTDIPDKPYEINWWDAKNVGEEIDSLAKQTPFDYVERHQWNTDKSDILHYIDLGYPRIGVARKNLLFNEENIVEVVPIQEIQDNYASAVLVIGAGDGADSIRAYRAEAFADRVRKEVVITDKTINTQARADARAASELAARRGRTFEISELVVNAYHSNAPIGSYGVGDDVQVQVEIPWLMETHIAWYRITSITNKPSSDKVRLGLSKADIFDNTSQVIGVVPDDYIPPPPIPPAPLVYLAFTTLVAVPVLAVGSTLIPAIQAGVLLNETPGLVAGVIAIRSAAVTLTVAKTLTAAGIATGASSATVTMTVGKTLSVGGTQIEVAAITLAASPTLTTNAVASRISAVALSIVPAIVVATGVPTGAANLAETATLIADTGANLVGAVALSVIKTLSVVANLTEVAAVSMSSTKTLTVGAAISTLGAVTMTASESLTTDGTVSTAGTSHLGNTADDASSSSSSGNKTTVSKFTAAASGTVTVGHARLWVDSGTASVQMCVYADSSGAPGALLALSNALTISNTTEAVNDFTFAGAQQASITSGTDYWIGHTWPDPGTNNIFWSRAGTASSAQQINTNAPNPFGTPTAASGPIDAYVDITTGGGGGGGTTLPVVRNTQAASGASAGTAANVTRPTGLAVGDLIVAVAVCDNDGSLANLTGPTGWNLEGSQAPAASGQPGMKIFSKVATSTETGAANFSFSAGTGIFCSAVVVAIQSGTYNSSTPLAATPSFNVSAASTTTHTAPSVTGVNNGLLLTAHSVDQGGAASNSYTQPSGMTEIADTAASAGYTGLEVNTLALTSTAATGTKSATCSNSRPFDCASFIINPA